MIRRALRGGFKSLPKTRGSVNQTEIFAGKIDERSQLAERLCYFGRLKCAVPTIEETFLIPPKPAFLSCLTLEPNGQRRRRCSDLGNGLSTAKTLARPDSGKEKKILRKRARFRQLQSRRKIRFLPADSSAKGIPVKQ